jgi:hypothetical protein
MATEPNTATNITITLKENNMGADNLHLVSDADDRELARLGKKAVLNVSLSCASYPKSEVHNKSPEKLPLL